MAGSKTETIHWSIVVAATLFGALWLRFSGAEFVRGHPAGYFLSPFLFFGMLFAELIGSTLSKGFARPAKNLAVAICVLVSLYMISQFFIIPISIDLSLLTYLILRRKYLSPHTEKWRKPEMWASIFMLALVLYIKITFLLQLTNIITGFVVGILLFTFDRLSQNKPKQGSAQQKYRANPHTSGPLI